ncbi:MAG: thioredoxin family protein [Cyclobacteriaceae bacterium]|nr:thioredoxin family protein [Cyclobacteriaceae bacterium]
MRKFLFIASILFIILFGGLQLFLYLNKPLPLDELRVRASVLPSLSLTTMDGESYEPKAGRPLVLIYFNTTCDHCQRQVEWFRKEISRFEGITLVWMSAQADDVLREFVRTTDFTGAEVDVVHVRHEVVAEKFGTLALPQIFVYDGDGRLVDLFSGETDPAMIRATLP